MNDYFEMVFENVRPGNLDKLLKYLFERSDEISDISIPEDVDAQHKNISHTELAKLFLEFDLNAAMVMLHGLSIDEKIKMPSVLLRIIKYEDKVDVDFSFEGSDSNWVCDTMLSAMVFCANLSARFSVGEIYAGMEPASDEDTRYFTNDKYGPLLIDYIKKKQPNSTQ